MSQSESSLPQTTNDDSPVDTPAETPKPESGGNPVLPLVLALLAFGISIALVVGGYFIWNQMQKLTGEQAGLAPRLEQQVQPLQTSLQAMTSDWQADRREIERRLGGLDDGQAAVGERIDRLASLVGRSELGWMLAEVEYLLRFASESLQLRRDSRTAVAALKNADARLRELADPQLLPVREQLARELSALREVPDVDVDGISLRLTDALKQVEKLPVDSSRYEPPEPDTKRFDATQTAGSWRDLPQVIWSSLTELFRIREHDKPISPMLPPERAWFLKENLRLQLAAARLALLREDREAYRQALATATEWLKEWFDAENQTVTAMAAGLEELVAVNIRPDLPDISRSLQLLRQVQKQQETLATPELVPATPESQPKPSVSQPEPDADTVGETDSSSQEEPETVSGDAP